MTEQPDKPTNEGRSDVIPEPERLGEEARHTEAEPSAVEVGQALAALTALERLVGQRWSGDAKVYAARVRKVLGASTASPTERAG